MKPKVDNYIFLFSDEEEDNDNDDVGNINNYQPPQNNAINVVQQLVNHFQ